MKKYEPLGNYLANISASRDSVTLTFRDLEKIIGARLPPSATKHRAWWANQETGSPAPHWKSAGFKVGKVDQKQAVVVFCREETARPSYTTEERLLEQELIEASRRAEEAIGSQQFNALLTSRGGLAAAKYCLRPEADAISSDFDGLIYAGRPDLTVGYVALQARFQNLFEPTELAEARRRLGWLEGPSIADIRSAIEEQASGFAFGALQSIRQRLKGLKRRSKTIFGPNTISEDYAFHYGGRTELQFNVGFELRANDERDLRHGVAISLRRGRTMHQIDDAILNRIARLNEYIESHADELSDFLMYNSWYDSDKWSRYHTLQPVPPEIVELDAFIFIGRRQSRTQVSTTLILRDFDRLLPMYSFVEGKGDPLVTSLVTPREFQPGVTRKQSSATASFAQRRLNKDLRHNDIQYALCQHLIEQHGKNTVCDEHPTGNHTKVDVAVKLGDELIYFEIKIGETARHCIRQAIGQLLEYSYWPQAHRAVRLIIVGEPALDPDAEKYLAELRREFGLPIYYQQWDMKSRRLCND